MLPFLFFFLPLLPRLSLPVNTHSDTLSNQNMYVYLDVVYYLVAHIAHIPTRAHDNIIVTYIYIYLYTRSQKNKSLTIVHARERFFFYIYIYMYIFLPF